MDNQVAQIAERIRGLRNIMEFSVEEMAEATGVTVDEYVNCEEGLDDYSFTFLYKCAVKFGVDIAELITGDMPKLSFYTVVRKDKGLPIERRAGFRYQHLGYLLKNRKTEPFLVKAKFRPEEQDHPIHLSTHEGQEFDYILKGTMKIDLDGHIEILQEGDAVYYDSAHPHGMIAVGGQDCEFLAIVIKA